MKRKIEAPTDTERAAAAALGAATESSTDTESETPLRPGENRGALPPLTESEEQGLKKRTEMEKERVEKEQKEKDDFDYETEVLLAFLNHSDFPK